MNRKIALSIACLFLLAAVCQTDTFGQRRKRINLRRSARTRTLSLNSCPVTISTCPLQGCGKGADFELNKSKNKTIAPKSSAVVDLTLDQMRNLSQPEKWKVNADRKEIQGKNLEGQAVRMIAYLWRAKREGGESCNCGIGKNDFASEMFTDIHMVLTDNPNDAEAISVTAEITPRVRALRPNPVTWTWTNIKNLNKKLIRVTGYLMLDTQHIARPLTRATNWEVHPITKLEVCTLSEAQCRAGKGWKSVN